MANTINLFDASETRSATVVVEVYGVTTKGNGDAFVNADTHTSLSIGGGQAGQGYPCVLVVKDGTEDTDREEIL